MSNCLRCGEVKLVKVTLSTKNNVDKWYYECKKCGLTWTEEATKSARA